LALRAYMEVQFIDTVDASYLLSLANVLELIELDNLSLNFENHC